MDITNNPNIVIVDDSINEASNMYLSFEMKQSRNMIGGKYTCEANKNKYEQICPVYPSNSTSNKSNLSKSEKNIFKTKAECENECEKKFINIQLKKSKLFGESVQFYLFIRDLIQKEKMKIYIKGGNVIGLVVLKLIYDEYKDDDIKFTKAFNNFLSMELIKDWDFTAYTNGKDTDEKYREKLDKIAAKYKLVPRAKTFILYQTKVPILVYDKALFEIAIIPSDTPYSKMEIPLTTMKVEVSEYTLKYIFIMAKNFYSYKTKGIPIDLSIIKKVISKTKIKIHPYKFGLYNPIPKIDTGDLNTNIVSFIKKFTGGNKYWTQFLITQLEDPYRLIYRMPEKNIKKSNQIEEFIKINLPKTNKPKWLLDTKKVSNVLDKFIEKLGLELKKIFLDTQLLVSVFDFLDGVNFGKPQIQIEWNEIGSEAKKKIKKIFSPLVQQIGKNEFKKMNMSLFEKCNISQLKPSEMTNTQRIIKFMNFLIENNFF
jgi:hypothetical protein